MSTPYATAAELPALTPAGERLLGAASDLFYSRGIRAVGVDLIAEVAGTTKKTLYDRFGSKDALAALYLRRRAQRWQARLLHDLDEHHPDPGRAQVLGVYDALERWMSEQERGCAFVNAYGEIGGSDHPGVPVIRAEKAWMRQLFERLAGDAGIAAPHDVAAQLHVLYEGAVVGLTAGDQPDSLAQARAAAAALLRDR